MNTVHWINQNLGWRIDKDANGRYLLHNQFGFAGTFKSLNEALQADAAMGGDPME